MFKRLRLVLRSSIAPATAATPTDWARIDAAFAQDDDPLFGDSQEERFRALFRKILELAPAPMGFGEAAEKVG